MRARTVFLTVICTLLLIINPFSQIEAAEKSESKVSEADLNKYKSRGNPGELDVRGPLPFDEEVSIAIKATVRKLLSKQKRDGSWDMEVKKRRGLEKTADDAVDPIVMTALCGMALRSHHEVDPEKIDKALTKARKFVHDRIRRGKLSTTVRYACWRYAFGLQFMNKEYKNVKDEISLKKIHNTSSRMLNSLLSMQLTSRGEQSTLVQYRKPANLGLIVSSDADLSSALIEGFVEGSAGATAGLKKRRSNHFSECRQDRQFLRLLQRRNRFYRW